MENQSQRGTPTKYKPEYAAIARQYCLMGATDIDLGKQFGVSEKTINNWKKQYPDFLQSVKEGKLIADMNVAEAFYKRCIGFEHHEVTREGNAPFNPSTGGYDKALLSVTKVVTKYIPPDAGAALNWLKNRQPEHWRDKVHIDLAAEIDLTMNLGDSEG
ncbi:helix-turn-helix domain-containing protein [Larkinella humicola]|uniref:Helix-turn-helix domain-containing protein n=1 Tax=Larkinella humicola TaxID=2607654 RepID=A0A5N1JD65_9BACT|nr:helix-turn-helix domain-containing protein [Larkinella humicola]KAA9349744.1 helix-turn-helix domain-containing protein [Larkinella humicola]